MTTDIPAIFTSHRRPASKPRRMRGATSWGAATTLLAALATAVILTACGGGGGPTPVSREPEDPEARAQEAEERREQDRMASEAMGQEMMDQPYDTEEDLRTLDELLAEQGLAPEETEGGTGEEGDMAAMADVDPYTGTAPPLRIAVLHHPDRQSEAIGIALMFEDYKKELLEKAVGRPVKIAFISQPINPPAKPHVIRYREGALQIAMKVAGFLPFEQSLEVMTEAERNRINIDMFIYVGLE